MKAILLSKPLLFASTTAVILAFAVFIYVDRVHAAVPEHGEFQIMLQSEDEVIFSWRPGSFEWRESSVTDGEIVSVANCCLNPRIGEARFPIRKVFIGIPLEGEPVVQVLSAAFTQPLTGALAVNKPIESSPAENARFQKSLASARYETVRTIGPYYIRNQRVIEVHINPLQMSGVSASSIAEEVIVRVLFNSESGSGEMASSDGHFEKIYESTILNYEQARRFRGREIEVSASSMIDVHPFALSTDWVKMAVMENGIYGITGTDLTDAGLDISAVDPSTLRLFWHGGRQIPVYTGEDAPEFRELAIRVTGSDDGTFNSTDSVIFYMHGADFVSVDSGLARPTAIRNSYTPRNYVWLTHGGQYSEPARRMGELSAAPIADDFSFKDRYRKLSHFEDERFLVVGQGGYIRDYYRWWWHDDEEYTIDINLDNVPPFTPADIFVSSYDHQLDIVVNGVSASDRGYDGFLRRFETSNLRDGSNSLDFDQFRYASTAYLDYFDVYHESFIRYAEGQIDFYFPPDTGINRIQVDFDISQIGDVIVLSTADVDNQRWITDYTLANDKLVFELEASEHKFDRFAVARRSDLRKPESISVVSPDPVQHPVTADLVVIAPAAFENAIQEFIDYRAQTGTSAIFEAVEDVYDNYSSGMLDPGAIKEYLKSIYENSEKPPGAVLLAGDGNYDFRNNLGRAAGQYIPPFVVETDSSISDENYVTFGEKGSLDADSSYGIDRGVDMMVGRWPVRSSSEVSSYIAKLKTYEDRATLGPWRNVVTLVADDEFKHNHSEQTESIHTRQSEILANEHIPDHVNVNKIYLTEYPFDSFNQKPQARSQVINSINEGTVLINYIGHGNPDLWADERVFYWKEDIYKLNNRNKPAVVFNASCSIGQFDSPLREAMAEELFRYPDGGAIATVAATRFVFADDNANFAYKSFDLMLSDAGYTLCEAVYVAKLLRTIEAGGAITNDRKYVVFADPMMYFGMPQPRVELTSLSPDSLSALSLTTVSGEIRDDSGLVDTDFSGSVFIAVFDADRDKRKELSGGYELPYILSGPRIFRGESQVASGAFEMSFIVPKDVSYGDSTARVSLYALSTDGHASGGLGSITISGSNPAISDSVGPSISVLRNGEKFDGGLVRSGDNLTVELSDSSGINLSGEVGHAIEISFDEDPLNTVDMTDEFVYHPGSFREGGFLFEVPTLASGPHTMRIKAWDSANNSSLRTYNIAVGELAGLVLSGVCNYPNPASEETRFSYHLSEPVADVTIDVYSLSGRLIKTLRGQPGDAGYNLSSAWDMTDFTGDIIANGIYIYKVSAAGRLTFAAGGDEDQTEGFGKLVVLK